jgi:hypothetical protein
MPDHYGISGTLIAAVIYSAPAGITLDLSNIFFSGATFITRFSITVTSRNLK